MSLVTDFVELHLPRHAQFLRTTLDLARRVGPVLRLGNNFVVTGESAVREVLSREQDFLSGVLYAPKMKLGPFILGMDRSEQYLAERAALVRALEHRAGDFGNLVLEEARRAAKALPHKQRVDLVASYVEPVMMRAASRFYGVSTQGAVSRYVNAAQGDATFAVWLRKLGAVIGSSSPAPFGLEALALNIADEVLPLLRRAVALHRDPTFVQPMPTVIGALLADDASPLDDAGIVRSVGGMMTAGATICKAFVHALHALLARPTQLRAASAAAARGEREQVLAYQWEALRFQPVFPLLVRYCPRDTTISAHPGPIAVPAGATVIVGQVSAMFDPNATACARSFRVGRPTQSYMHFGHGQHRCIGEWLANAALPAMFCALAELPGWLDTKPGSLEFDGPAIGRYELRI